MRGFRASLLRFGADDAIERVEDALVVVARGRIVDADAHDLVAPRHPGLHVVDWRGLLIAPGFVDAHVHYAQVDAIASHAGGLLAWLEDCTFPSEARFSDRAHACEVAGFFLDELARNGVTTAMVWCSSHAASAEAFFSAAARRGARMIAGQCLMDRNAPRDLCDDPERGLADSEALIRRWHRSGRLGYALTPRFAPACSERLLRGVAALADAHDDVWLQTHLAESRDEVAWVAKLFPGARSYLDVYDRLGLVRPRSVYAHCLHLDDTDRARMREGGASVAVCPTSNLFLGSGLFDFGAAQRSGLRWALASDVGAGTTLSPFRTMLAAYEVARLGGVSLSPSRLWQQHTLGAARALDLGECIGNVAPGFEADFVALDPAATAMLARRTRAADSLDELLFAMIVLGDDRVVRHTVVAGEPVPLAL